MDPLTRGEPVSAYASSTFGREYSFEVNKPVGSMSISPCGRDVVLASRQGLHVVDLDDPYAPPRHLPHYTPWEVADVQWSPFPSRDHWVVSTSNQKALVWNLMMSDARSAVEHYLHAHTRAITDINFSAHNPDILATCAVDSFVHCWDLRNPARPALSFADWFAGATQVKWNRQDAHIIASSHDKFLRVWDNRMGCHPVHSIEAHDTKIYGLDWNRIRTTALVTCSLDKTIKFWDYSLDTEKPEHVIQTPFPIWRARHTPFGHGVLAMPQRDDNDLYLYNRQADAPDQDISSPVRSFQGHTAQVKEFLWRCRGKIQEDGADQRQFQLVTWGADRVLRLHPMDEASLGEVGYSKGMKVNDKLNLTRIDATYKTFRNIITKPSIASVKSSTSLHDKPQIIPASRTAKSGLTAPRHSGIGLGGFLNTRPSANNDAARQKDLDPISWMKGVKVGKKDLPLDQSVNSNALIDHRTHRESEEFENLGEEIAHVGQKFGKVDFMEANVNQRNVKISMQGLWGQKESTYLECRIEFPIEYPAGRAPHLTIEKTALLHEDILSKIEEDVAAIGDAYLKFKRNSLEAIVRYLHGDQNLDDVLSWTKLDLDQTVPEFHVGEESSSDEEDLDLNQDDHDLDFGGLADSELLDTSAIHANMPLAKPCAGVWGPVGTLVCFFPPKEKPPTLAGSLGLQRQGGLLKAARKYMLGGHSKGSKSSKRHSISSFDSEESLTDTEGSDSEHSSSASSTSSRGQRIKDIAMVAQHVFDVDHFGLSTQGTDRILDGTVKSGETGGIHQTRSPKSILRLHDLSTILPPKKELAEEYVLSGSNACKINAEITRKYGYEDLSEVWMLLDLIIHGKIEQFGDVGTNKRPANPASSILSTHGEAVSHLVDFVRWSYHPLGGQMLIGKLFDYYAGIADVQMLAMMSCVLAERDSYALRSQASKTVTKHKFKFSPAIKKIYDQEYFPPSKDARSQSPQGIAGKIRATSLKSPLKTRHDINSLSSSFGTIVNDPASLESSVADLSTNRSFEGRSSTPKLSTSPEWIRPFHRSTTNLANAVLNSINRPFSSTVSAASSPPGLSFMKKKVSPIGSLMTSAWNADKSASSLDFSRSSSAKNSERRVRISRRPSESKPARGMVVILKNQDKFEQRESVETPLLDPEKAALYQFWRADYAELLLSWDILVTRAELLKFNVAIPRSVIRAGHSRESSLTAGIEESTNGNRTSATNVVPAAICQVCDMADRLQDSSRICSKCQVIGITLCVLCNQPVRTRGSPCFACGHVLHVTCRSEWQRMSESPECPTGCGCTCDAPDIPPYGLVSGYSTPALQRSTTRTSRNTSIHLTLPASRRMSPAASTIRGFHLAAPQEHQHRASTSTTDSQMSTTTVESNAQASLQSLAAQSRPRKQPSESQHGQQLSNAALDADTKNSKLRQSKSLIFAAGFGAIGEGKRSRTHRLSSAGDSGTTTPALKGESNGRGVKGGQRGKQLSNRNNSSGSIGRQRSPQPQSVRQEDSTMFELGLDGDDDSDVDGRPS